eukprot:CAMPEP_0119361050 /NCGR_PEP_ID=MMETSP1334-20130426/8466_1 /TAXON_ID=127549 /ORGANISM="Calcidiscus leptoporus, Strain RCC1130" /LENGTH=115 /DNA_ID=CAMNT_0007375977 /DNA_START=149 /DNA_END=495 /DNA_ORIENTATION=+
MARRGVAQAAQTSSRPHQTARGPGPEAFPPGAPPPEAALPSSLLARILTSHVTTITTTSRRVELVPERGTDDVGEGLEVDNDRHEREHGGKDAAHPHEERPVGVGVDLIRPEASR